MSAHRVCWTSREWLTVLSALPPMGDRAPTPAQMDAAQRAALPPDRWRPRSVFSGRLNRAVLLRELNLARARQRQEPTLLQKLAARLVKLRQELDAVNAQIAALPPRVIEVRHAEPVEELPLVTAPSPSPVEFLPPPVRVDVVGLIGQQVTRVRRLLAEERPDLLRGVRFVLVDQTPRDPAARVVLVTQFVNHSMQAKYAGSRRKLIPKPTARRVVTAMSELTEYTNG